MDFPVVCRNEQIGTLRAEEDGLYWDVFLSCPKPPLPYLYGEDENARLCLGILVPNADVWTLHRKIAKKALHLTQKTRFYLAEKEDGVFLCGSYIPKAKITETGAEKKLSLPYDEHEAFTLMQWARYFSIEEENGVFFWTCNFDAQNRPVFVDNAAKYDKISEDS